MTRLQHAWSQLSATYWFVPTVMMSAAAALALVMVWADLRLLGAPRGNVWLYTGGADGARAMLSTIAGSVITVAGVGFSIAIVTLTQASSQFGPRLLRNFMRDRGNQLVLGTWVGTFIYGVLVLRTVRGGDDGAFVPHASVTLGVLLSVASVGALVYFIHHVSFSLQAPQLVASVASELPGAVRRVFPGRLGTDGDAGPGAEPAWPGFERSARPVLSRRSGYLQAVDERTLMDLAETEGLRLRVTRRPGDFVPSGQPLMFVSPAPVAEELAERLERTFFLGAQPTDDQDPEFTIKQLVEVAVRSLSPGINDPFTAIHCVDWLAAGLADLAGQELPSPARRDRHGEVRIVARAFSFTGAVDAAFHQLRQHASGDVAVTARLLEAMAGLGQALVSEEQRRAVRRQVRLTYEAARRAARTEGDARDLDRRYRAALAAVAPNER